MPNQLTLEDAVSHLLKLSPTNQTVQSAQLIVAEMLRLRAVSGKRELSTGSPARISQNGREYYGLLREIANNGTVQIPDNGSFIPATEDSPAALLEVFTLSANGEWIPTGTHVGAKLESFEEVDGFPVPASTTGTADTGTARQNMPALVSGDTSAIVDAVRKSLKAEFTQRFQGIAKSIDELAQTQQRGLLFEQVVDQVYDYLWSNEETWQMWVHAFYWENGQLFIITSDEGRLMRAPLTITDGAVTVGPFEMVEVQFQPTGAGGGEGDGAMGEEEMMQQAKKRQVSRVIRQDGKRSLHLRCSSVSILNRSGQLDSSAMFRKMAERAQETGQMPYRDIFHLGKDFSVGRALGVWADEYTLLELVELEDAPSDTNVWAKVMSRALEADPEFWGDSIEFLPRGSYELCDEPTGVCVTVFNDAVHIATTFLPESMAASLYTFGTVLAGSQERGGFTRMNTSVKDAILALVNDYAEDGDKEALIQQVESFDSQHRQVLSSLKQDAAAGAVIRQAKPQQRNEVPATNPAPVTSTTAPNVDEIVRGITESQVFKDLAKGVSDHANEISQLRQTLEAHAADIARLKGEEVDEERRSKDAPPITQKQDVAFRPSRDVKPEGQEKPMSLSAVAAASRQKFRKEGEKEPTV